MLVVESSRSEQEDVAEITPDEPEMCSYLNDMLGN